MKPRAFIPHLYQLHALEHVLAVPRCALFSGVGTGKTVTTLTAIAHLKEVGELGFILVIATKRVAESVWPVEPGLWEHTAHLRFRSVVGATPAKREKLLKAALAEGADGCCINYESAEHVLGMLKELGVELGMVVLDEGSKMRGLRPRQGTKRAKAIYVATRHVPRVVLLTGTPSPNGLEGLYGQVFCLDHGERLGKAYGSFLGGYFHAIQIDERVTIYKPRSDSLERVSKLIKDICLSIRAEDYFPVDEARIVPVLVKAPAAALKAYEALARDSVLELGGDIVKAVNSAVLKGKLLQAASGTLYSTDGTVVELHDAKLDALESVVEELQGRPLLVFYTYKADLERLKKRFPKARVLRGDADVRDWNEGRIEMLLAQPASAGHGLSLQHGGCDLAFFSPLFDAELYEQARARLGPLRQMQSGYKRVVTEYHLLTDETIDAEVLDDTTGKLRDQNAVMDSVKHHLAGLV